MRKRLILTSVSCLVIFTMYSCLDSYNPPSTTANVNYLVVDGFLNGTDKSCTITLSRSIPLNTTSAPIGEGGALVKLEDEEGNTMALPEIQSGQYSASNLALSSSKRYKLSIITRDGNLYISDPVSVLSTPSIDDVTWDSKRNGLAINLSTHDPANNTRYYSWKYKETWMYHSAYDSYLKVESGKVLPREINERVYYCWQSGASTDIIISSSTTLEEDIIHDFTITTIPWSSIKLGIKYSILVEQRTLSKESYDYQQQLKKNTENLGTLFDALPTRITGNIRCITDPNELVLGYFTASEIQLKRIFVSRSQVKLPDNPPIITTGYEACEVDSVLSLDALIPGIPISELYKEGSLIGYTYSGASCVDCRLQRGTNVKPSFWE